MLYKVDIHLYLFTYLLLLADGVQSFFVYFHVFIEDYSFIQGKLLRFLFSAGLAVIHFFNVRLSGTNHFYLTFSFKEFFTWIYLTVSFIIFYRFLAAITDIKKSAVSLIAFSLMTMCLFSLSFYDFFCLGYEYSLLVGLVWYVLECVFILTLGFMDSETHRIIPFITFGKFSFIMPLNIYFCSVISSPVK